MTKLTEILTRLAEGDKAAKKELFPMVYAELRRLAQQQMARENPGHTLQATALVHEVYLKLLGNNQDPQWNSRGHFFVAATEAMRRILVDQARCKLRTKRGGRKKRLQLSEYFPAQAAAPDAIVGMDEALQTFEREFPEKAQLLKLRYFGGLSLQETTALMGISPATGKRYWAFARAWLYNRLIDDSK